MKIGLFFGSFNPVHIGHLALANYIVEYTDLDQFWFVVSPQNPFKEKETLLSDQVRLEMLELAIEGDNRFVVCDIEFRMPKPSYTIDTLTYLHEKHPKYEFVLIMGSDGLPTFHKWKNHEFIVSRYHRLIYPRITDTKVNYDIHRNFTLLHEAPKIEISSSFIRQAIREGKDIRHFLPSRVYDYIVRFNLYHQ
jgi:nicotinate-nucleotide adenylyltransferase